VHKLTGNLFGANQRNRVDTKRLKSSRRHNPESGASKNIFCCKVLCAARRERVGTLGLYQILQNSLIGLGRTRIFALRDPSVYAISRDDSAQKKAVEH